MSELKPGWTRVKFGDVVRLANERCLDPIAAGIDRYIGLEHLEPGDLRIRKWGDIAEGTTFTTRVRPGQVLFGKRRAYQRKVAVADFDAVCSGDIYVFEGANASQLFPELLPFVCQTEEFFEHAIGTSAGSLSPRTNWASLANYEFALPPLNDQRRAASVLRAHQLLGQSLHICEASIRGVRASLARNCFVDDETFPLVRLNELIETNALSLQTGPFGSVLSASTYQQHGHPVINPVDMRDGRIELDATPCVGDADWERLKKYWMREGDVLLGRKRHMRNLVFVEAEHAGYVIGSDCIRLRVDSQVLHPRFFFQLMRADSTQHWLQAQAGGNGTVMPGMNEQILGRLDVRLPDLGSQARIANKIDSLDDAQAEIQARRNSLRTLQRQFANELFVQAR